MYVPHHQRKAVGCMKRHQTHNADEWLRVGNNTLGQGIFPNQWTRVVKPSILSTDVTEAQVRLTRYTR